MQRLFAARSTCAQIIRRQTQCASFSSALRFDETQLEFKGSVARFAQENIKPHASKIDQTNSFPQEYGVILSSAERGTQVALQAIQCLGGNGYVNEYTGRLLRDAKLYEIGEGTSEIRRMIIGGELFKET